MNIYFKPPVKENKNFNEKQKPERKLIEYYIFKKY